MASLAVKTQGDDEIETHILSVVDSETLKKEEALAKHIKGGRRTAGQKRNRRTMLDQLGLTAEASVVETQRRRRVVELEQQLPKENEQDLAHRSLLRSQSNDADDQGDAPPQASLAEANELDDEHDKENTSGRILFGFSATSRKGKSTQSMMKKAMEDQTEDKTITTGGSRKKRTARGKQSVVKTITDHAKRQRIQRQMELLKDNRQSDDDEASSSASEDEDEEDKEAEESRLLDEQPGYERYFQELHGKSTTSNNTMSKLPVLEPAEFDGLLASSLQKHKDDIGDLIQMHKRHFPQWFFELNAGFNLLFYGYGSKRHLLNTFSQETLTDGPLLVINGFFPSISIKDILAKIMGGVLPSELSTSSIQDSVSIICNYFASEDRIYDKMYLIIHNIDGNNLRNERAQTALSILAHAPNIHLIASIDHINASLLWDSTKASRFNWIWHDATTFDNYLVETSFEDTLLVRTSEMGGARGAQYVLRSLTSNARGVFRVLAEHQLVEMEMEDFGHARGNESVGLTYSKYYDKCRESFFVSTDVAFRSQLTEFHDHKIIHSKRLVDGTEVFYIPLDKSTLTGLLEEMLEQ
ncbi:origin recognition complex subunit 2-domain-containing protein [Dichotomocladium elegans]|nr:origin recognition complex subunit 2-domain-containing protein [Dichotomocladium elegans]